MNYSFYDKPYKSCASLIAKLRSQDLIVNDEEKANKILSSINYFRFKIYLRVFLDTQTKKFNSNSSFEDAYSLYCFDEELRTFLHLVIGQAEISLRTKLEQHITEHLDNPFWYLDDRYFINKGKINKIRTTFRNEFLRSRDDFSVHYRSNYINKVSTEFKDMPPSWIMSELSTFGNILSLLEAINKRPFDLPHNKNVLDKLSKKFGANNLKQLNSWLKLMRDVRNRVAHYNRVWNCNYREPNGVRQQLLDSFMPTQSNKIYLFFIVLERLYECGIVRKSVKHELREFIEKYPIVNEFLSHMGIPNVWLDG